MTAHDMDIHWPKYVFFFFTDVYASTTYKLTFSAPGQNPWNTSEVNNSWTLETVGTVGTLAVAPLSSTTDTLFFC